MKINMQTGRSMIEMLGVLAIIGILTVGGFGLVTKANMQRKVAAVVEEIGDLAQKVRIVARDYTGDTGDMTSYVYNGKAYPDTLEYSSTSFSGTEDTTYTVSYTKQSSTNSFTFTIQANNLTTEMCMEVLTTNWGSPSTSGFISIAMAGESALTLPVDIGTASDKCGDSNSVQLTFR